MKLAIAICGDCSTRLSQCLYGAHKPGAFKTNGKAVAEANNNIMATTLKVTMVYNLTR